MRKILLSAVVLFCALPASAATVHVLRGADTETVTVPRDGIAVVRGGGAPAAAAQPAPEKAAQPSRYAVAGGTVLWIVDTVAGRLTACSLRGTGYVGQDRIHCRAARLR